MSYIGKASNSRTKWLIKPVTKVKQSKKVYDRNKDTLNRKQYREYEG